MLPTHAQGSPLRRYGPSEPPAEAVAPDATFALVSAYDRLRLSLYRDKGARHHLISVASLGSTTLLRFEDVGYFNRVYGGSDVAAQLDAAERFFRGSPHGCRLVTPALPSTDRLGPMCVSRGWQPEQEYGWLSTTDLSPRGGPCGDFELRAPSVNEQETFLGAYLTAFGADPARHAMATENMRHLFSLPDLHFFFAFRGRQPAGIGMMYHVGESALLCAGATLPAYRSQGCHEALLAGRIRLARELGCTAIHGWAVAGSQSHANMEGAGLQTTGTSRVWRLPAALCA